MEHSFRSGRGSILKHLAGSATLVRKLFYRINPSSKYSYAHQHQHTLRPVPRYRVWQLSVRQVPLNFLRPNAKTCHKHRKRIARAYARNVHKADQVFSANTWAFTLLTAIHESVKVDRGHPRVNPYHENCGAARGEGQNVPTCCKCRAKSAAPAVDLRPGQ